MKLDVLLGLQWGDEGKGKIVDVLAPKYDIIARFQGGPNAGHTLEFNGKKHILHIIPSGIFREECINLIGNGVVIDPIIFKHEIEEIEKHGFDPRERILISKKAHLIMPGHKMLDAAQEQAKGKNKIGSTLKGIGPAYTDKIARNGLRIGDILKSDFEELYQLRKNAHVNQLNFYNYKADFESIEKEWMEGIALLKEFRLIDGEHFINKSLDEGKKVLAEGAQGTLLDIDFGSYPFVTSSNTVCAGACTGLGIAPARIGEVFGIFKAYCTRVGSGPFPTELFDENGELLRDQGHEYGSTTGRPRRCGWLDLVALKYTSMLNGVSQLLMTKADVLSTMKTLSVATKYKSDQGISDEFPYDITADVEPVFEELPGWAENIENIRDEKDFPKELSSYIDYIEKNIGVPVRMVSVSPDREAIIYR